MYFTVGFPSGSVGKESPAMPETQEMPVQSLDREDPLEEGMETHSSILAWRIPWMEKPDGLQSVETQSWTWLKQLSMHAFYCNKAVNTDTQRVLGVQQMLHRNPFSWIGT